MTKKFFWIKDKNGNDNYAGFIDEHLIDKKAGNSFRPNDAMGKDNLIVKKIIEKGIEQTTNERHWALFQTIDPDLVEMGLEVDDLWKRVPKAEIDKLSKTELGREKLRQYCSFISLHRGALLNDAKDRIIMLFEFIAPGGELNENNKEIYTGSEPPSYKAVSFYCSTMQYKLNGLYQPKRSFDFYLQTRRPKCDPETAWKLAVALTRLALFDKLHLLKDFKEFFEEGEYPRSKPLGYKKLRKLKKVIDETLRKVPITE